MAISVFPHNIKTLAALGVGLLISCATSAQDSSEDDAEAAAYSSRAVAATGPEGELAGALVEPEGDSQAVVLIIPGSGPTDRDGNNPMGVNANSYRLLAEALAERGIASARIDKRGMFGSENAVDDPNAVTIADYVSDVRVWRDTLLRETGAECIWLAGHSEGGLVALAAAQEDGICGLVLLAAPGRPMADILRQQLRANPANAPLLDQVEAAIASLEAGERVDTTEMHPALAGLFNANVQGFLIDMMSYDPADLIAAYDGRVLIAAGTADLQVGEADAQRLSAAQPSAEQAMIENMNHVLKIVEGGQAANMATYRDPDLPISPELVGVIAAFVTE